MYFENIFLPKVNAQRIMKDQVLCDFLRVTFFVNEVTKKCYWFCFSEILERLENEQIQFNRFIKIWHWRFTSHQNLRTEHNDLQRNINIELNKIYL